MQQPKGHLTRQSRSLFIRTIPSAPESHRICSSPGGWCRTGRSRA